MGVNFAGKYISAIVSHNNLCEEQNDEAISLTTHHSQFTSSPAHSFPLHFYCRYVNNYSMNFFSASLKPIQQPYLLLWHDFILFI